MWGEGDAIAGAIEKANAEIVFEGLDLKRDGGLGEEKMFRGLAKVQMFGDGAENLEAEVFQLGHGMIIHGKCGLRDAFWKIADYGCASSAAGRVPRYGRQVAGATLLRLRFLCFLQERAQGVDRDAESAAGESVHVGGVDADDFAAGVEDRAAAAAVGGGGVVDEFVADYVAEMAAGGRRTNQR